MQLTCAITYSVTSVRQHTTTQAAPQLRRRLAHTAAAAHARRAYARVESGQRQLHAEVLVGRGPSRRRGNVPSRREGRRHSLSHLRNAWMEMDGAPQRAREWSERCTPHRRNAQLGEARRMARSPASSDHGLFVGIDFCRFGSRRLLPAGCSWRS